MSLSRERVGQAAIGGHAFTEALVAVIGKELGKTLSPIVSLALATPIAFLAVAGIILGRGAKIRIPNKEAIRPLLYSTLMFGFILPFATFWAVRLTSAGNVSIILTLEIVLSYLYFNVWGKEPMDFAHKVGALLMFLSSVFVLVPNVMGIQWGDFIVLAAVIVIPKGNAYTLEAKRKGVTGEQIIFYRTMIATPLVVALALVFVDQFTFPTMRTWVLIVTMGAFALGVGKILWVEGIARIPVTTAASIASVKVILTHILGFFILHSAPTTAQWMAVPTAIIGIILLQRSAKKS